jgi:hypothetical protein
MKTNLGMGSDREGFPLRKPRAKAGGHEMLRHLASVAIVRDNSKAFARHLAAGLDPHAMFYEGAQCFDHQSLLEAAAAYDSTECYLALIGAGVRPSERSIEMVFHPKSSGGRADHHRILRRLLDAGSLDPRADAWPGVSCDEMARPDGRVVAIICAAKARLESAELRQALPELCASRSRRSRSI